VRRFLAVAWLVVAAALWNGFFDLYVSRGAREYLQQEAEYAAGLGPDPALDDVMARARRHGVVAATLWTVVVLGLGWASLRVSRRDEPPDPGGRNT
jgi:hypothetical protein